jgi:hypothetical protein
MLQPAAKALMCERKKESRRGVDESEIQPYVHLNQTLIQKNLKLDLCNCELLPSPYKARGTSCQQAPFIFLGQRTTLIG